jgi:SAM-dependent methyltransferase
MNASRFCSWEEAVSWLVSQSEQQELVAACYFDRPVRAAAERFWRSEEWQAVRALLPACPGKALDVGAGNGIASFALARDGWETTALEPDGSNWVGTGAIRQLAADSGLHIDVVQEFGETLPFADASFNVIHARQVLHHARDLAKLCLELFRVLRPRGILIATREHVISSPRQLQSFLRKHPLQRFYGGEHAFRLREYLEALRSAGFIPVKIMGPFDSPVNYAPFTRRTLKSELSRRFARLPGGNVVAGVLLSERWFDLSLQVMSRLDRRPGRLFSFVARKTRD